LPAKAFPIELHGGDVFIQWCGGGSGLGDPLLRDPARVAADVRDEKITIEFARREHGVVIDPATLEVDREATARARAERR
jgi:N-methylhydantoinase B